jgi:tripartite-type tricarboxylate transporter receptor subunit TctC
MKKFAWAWLSLMGLAFATGSTPAYPQDSYPSSPIKLVVPFAAGATGDVVARLLAQKLTSQMNASVVVDDKLGANGNLGADYVAKSKPDGYTLLLNTASAIISRAFGEKVSYDILNDFAPIALVTSSPELFVVSPSLPVDNIADFISYLKTNPNKLAYGSSGNSNLLSIALFLQINGAMALNVPYKGGAYSLVDLAAGRIQFVMQSMSAVLPMVKDKRVKVIAIGGTARSPELPDVPTLSEVGISGFETGTWQGVLAPSRTPAAIIKRLNSEILKALQDPDMKARLAKENINPLGSSPDEYAKYLKEELERSIRVIQTAGIKSE